MTSANEDARRLAELEGLLETWGGEPVRWPAEVGRRIEALTATGPRARQLLAEARALDRVLDRARDAPAQLSTASREALADRILAAALAGPVTTIQPAPRATTTAQVIALPTGRAKASAARMPAPAFGSRWHAAGLMAASLLAGVYLGGSVNLAPVVQELADVVGLQTVVDPALSALGDDLGDEETP